MSKFFTPRMDSLPPTQIQLWPQLKPAAQLGYVLYGGTAIALRLGHRVSVDFDFFSDFGLDIKALHAAMPFLEAATVLQQQPDGLTVLVQPAGGESPVKLSFFCEIDFGRVGEPQLTEDKVLRVASLDDLLATKLKVILQRVESKDYKDVAALIAAGMSLGRGLASAKALFGPSFQASESLKALVYFKGGDLQTLSDKEKSILVESVKRIETLPMVEKVSSQLT